MWIYFRETYSILKHTVEGRYNTHEFAERLSPSLCHLTCKNLEAAFLPLSELKTMEKVAYSDVKLFCM